jgi:nucleoside-diphosphate-sugar epimerase
VISLFVTRLLNDEAPVIYGDGEQSRDFTYVDNAVQANLKAAEMGPSGGETYNVACGGAVTVNELFRLIRKLTGREGIEPVYDEARKGDVRHSLADIDKAKATFGYDPAVGLEEGLRRTVEWYQENSVQTSNQS